MIINAMTAKRTDGNYRQHTVRLALDEAIRSTLTKPGDMLRIDGAINTDSTPVSVRTLQIVLAQITPKGWKIKSERTPDGSLEIWRLK